MIETTPRSLPHDLLAGVALCLVLSCSNASRACRNEAELWINRVFEEQECSGCIELNFSARILQTNTLRIEAEPDYVLSRCGVAQVLGYANAVVLVLSPQVNESLALFRQALAQSSTDAIVSIRLPDAQLPLGVMYSKDLKDLLLAFELTSEKEVDEFIGELQPDKMTVLRSSERIEFGSAEESLARSETNQLLPDFPEQGRILKELQAAYERGADDDTLRSLLNKLEMSVEQQKPGASQEP